MGSHFCGAEMVRSLCLFLPLSRLGVTHPHSLPSSFLALPLLPESRGQFAHEPLTERRGYRKRGPRSCASENLAGDGPVTAALTIF